MSGVCELGGCVRVLCDEKVHLCEQFYKTRTREHKGRYSEECKKQNSIFLLLWKSTVPQNSPITNFLQNIFLCVQNKHIHTGLDLLEDDDRFSLLGALSL